KREIDAAQLFNGSRFKSSTSDSLCVFKPFNPLGSVQNRVQKQSVEVWLDRIREPSHCFGSGRPTSSTTTRRVPTSEAHVRRGHQKVIGVSPDGRLERLEQLKRLEQAPLVEQYLASD